MLHENNFGRFKAWFSLRHISTVPYYFPTPAHTHSSPGLEPAALIESNSDMKRPNSQRNAVGTPSYRQAGMVDLPEVLELVLSCADDAALLCKATTVSTYYKDLVLTRIQQHLPELLVCAVKQAADAPEGQEAGQAQQQTCCKYTTDYTVRKWNTNVIKMVTIWGVQNAAQAHAAATWLCAVAGRDAVGQQQVTDALLSPGMVVDLQGTPGSLGTKRIWLWAPYLDTLTRQGLRMTESALVSAAQQQLPPLGECLKMHVVLKEQDGAGMDELLGAVVTNSYARDPLMKLLEKVQPSGDRIMGLMFIAANEGAQNSVQCLIQHAKLKTQLLTGVAGAGAAAAAGHCDSAIQDQESQQQTCLQQEVDEQQQQAEVRLQQLENLLLTCLTADHVDLVNLLIEEAPAVALLGEAHLTRLLQAAALLGNPVNSGLRHVLQNGPSPSSALDILCKMAAAKYVSCAAIVSVVRLLLLGESSESWECRSLLKLPGTDSIDSSQLCSLLRLACNKGAGSAVTYLAQLAVRRGMPHSSIMQLLYTLLEEQPAPKFMEILDMLQPLKFWTHMSDAEVVDVLVRVTLKSKCLEVAHHIYRGMAAFHFKQRKFTDTASYVRFIGNIASNCCYEEDRALFSVRFLTAAYAPQLGVQDCIELMRYCIVQHGYVPKPFLQLPAAKDVPSDEVYALMQLCMHQRPPPARSVYSDADFDPKAAQPPAPYAAGDLAQLPAAQDLSVQQLTEILQLNMRQEEWQKWRALTDLLRLPAAQQIDTATAQGLLSAALESESMDSVDILCKHVPACAAAWMQMDVQQLVQYLDALLRKISPKQIPKQSEFHALFNHPSLQEHVQQILPQLLLSAFACIRVSLTGSGGICQHLDQSAEANLQALLQLPAAQTLSAAVLRQLMQLSLLHMGGSFLPELVRPPAAAQLQQEDVAVLLQAALGRPCAAGSSKPGVGIAQDVYGPAATGCSAVAAPPAEQPAGQQASPNQQQGDQGEHIMQHKQQRLQQHQGQQQAQQQGGQMQGSADCSSSSSLPDLLQQCLQHPTAGPHMFQLLTLPWVQQLPAGVLEGLLVAAAERQYKALFNWLLQQPQAPRDDAEVQAWVKLLRLSAGAPAADPCCWAPQPSPRQGQLQACSDSDVSDVSEGPLYEEDSPLGDDESGYEVDAYGSDVGEE